MLRLHCFHAGAPFCSVVPGVQPPPMERFISQSGGYPRSRSYGMPVEQMVTRERWTEHFHLTD